MYRFDGARRVDAAEGRARLIVADVHDNKTKAAANAFQANIVDVGDVHAVKCDVFAPCAVGQILDADVVPHLRCATVAGSANNQLAVPEDAGQLLDRGILYTPDYVINAGGAMAFGLMRWRRG